MGGQPGDPARRRTCDAGEEDSIAAVTHGNGTNEQLGILYFDHRGSFEMDLLDGPALDCPRAGQLQR